MAQLKQEQIKQYYASEGKKKDPMSPTEWGKQQGFLEDKPVSQDEGQTELEGLKERAEELRGRIEEHDMPEMKVEDPASPVEPADHLLDTLTPAQQLEQMEADRQAKMEEDKAERDRLMADQRERAEEVAEVTRDRKVEPVVREEQERFQVEQTMADARTALREAAAMQQRAISLEEQRDAAISAVSQQGISTPFISREEAKIAESYDRRVSTIAAQAGAQSAYAQALQGQVSQARGLISDIVDAYTYDTDLELQRINTFMDLNREEIGMLDAEYQNALQESQRHWENQLNEEKEEREAVLNMMISHPEAGITANDDIEEAVEKSSEWLAIQPDQDVKSMVEQYPQAFTGMTQEQIDKMTFAEAINKIAQIPETPRAPDVFGGQQVGYFTWEYDDASGTWVPKQVVGGAPGAGDEVVGVGEMVDIWNSAADEGLSATDVIRRFKDRGFERANVRAFLDKNTDLKVSSVTELLETVYDIPAPETLALGWVAAEFDTKWLRTRPGEVGLAKQRAMARIQNLPTGSPFEITDDRGRVVNTITITEELKQNLLRAIAEIEQTRDMAKTIIEMKKK